MCSPRSTLRAERERLSWTKVVDNPALGVAVCVIEFGEKPAVVAENLRLNDQHAGDGSLDDVHRVSSKRPAGDVAAHPVYLALQIY